MQFLFDDHVLDLHRRELHRNSLPVAVEPQVFDLLIYLVQNRDRVVSRDDIFAAVWGGRVVSDSTLASRINAARRAVGDSGGEQRLIRTVARKGIRFVGAVRTRLQPHPLHGALAPGDPAGAAHATLGWLDQPAVAVLPFLNMSGEPEREHFCDGIGEDIITALSKLRRYLVIARNASFAYKGRAGTMKQIAQELGVGYLVEGSVRKSGDIVRITAQLGDVATGGQLWAERYDRSLADTFAVQDEIADAVVAAIEPQIYAAETFHAQCKPRPALRAGPRDPFPASYGVIAGYADYAGRTGDEAMRPAREALRPRPECVTVPGAPKAAAATRADDAPAAVRRLAGNGTEPIGPDTADTAPAGATT